LTTTPPQIIVLVFTLSLSGNLVGIEGSASCA